MLFTHAVQSKASREMGILLRKLHTSVRDLHGSVQLLRESGSSLRHVDTMARQVTMLHAAVENMVVIKELRTPVVRLERGLGME